MMLPTAAAKRTRKVISGFVRAMKSLTRGKIFPPSLARTAAPGFPKFTNEVQHFLDKVLQWDDAMNSFRLKSAVHFPDLAKPGRQSAKSRQLWIARHRL